MGGNRNLPDFYFERKLWLKGCEFVAGLDEVGRGCFVGPVVCGCVVFKKGSKSSICRKSRSGILESKLIFPYSTCTTYSTSIPINDSKKLTPRQREIASRWIK